MPTHSNSQDTRPPAPADRSHNTSVTRFRPMWICIFLALLVVGVLYWFVGVTWWSLFLAVLVLGCPLVIVWILLGGFDR